MNKPLFKTVLETYYDRTYKSGVTIRLASVALCAALAWRFHAMALWGCALWAAGYALGELILILWWRRVQPGLEADDAETVLHHHRELLVLSCLLSNFAAIPTLATVNAPPPAQILGLMIAAGSLLIITAQHSLNRHMFLWNAPVFSFALLLNLFKLAHGPDQWVIATLGAFFILNAYKLHHANSASIEDRVKIQVAAEAANAAKSAFLATISHEIRTPLNGVLGMAHVMSLHELSDEQRNRLDVVTRSGESLLSLLNDLLDFSKIEAGKIESQSVPFNFKDLLVSECQPILELTAEQAGVDFILDADEVDAVYLGDPLRIGQVVKNLVTNAHKFTQAGEIRVTGRQTGASVTVTVADTGIGIAPEDQTNLFRRFTQADASTTRRFGGTGLGLAISQSLCDLMGGGISVTSAPGEGSCFTVSLPLTPTGDPERDGREGAAEAGDDPLREVRLKVLIAEDNPTNQLVLTSLLEHADADFTVVGDGEAAVAAWKAGGWDLILMDIHMPLKDGMMATREIRELERRSGGGRTPIFALTADAMDHQTAEHRAAGIDGHIAKPIKVSELFGVLAGVATSLGLAA